MYIYTWMMWGEGRRRAEGVESKVGVKSKWATMDAHVRRASKIGQSNFRHP